MEYTWFTSLLECRGQREEVRSEESEVSVLHMIPYDRDQPAAWELQVIPGAKEQQHTVSYTTIKARRHRSTVFVLFALTRSR